MKWLGSEVDLRTPEKYHLILWRYLGLIPPKESGFKRNLYIFYSVMMHIFFTITLSVTISVALMKVENFMEFCESAYVAISVCGAGMKLASTFLILPKLHLLSEMSNRLHNRIKSEFEVKCLREAITQGHRAFFGITLTFIAQITIAFIFSLLNTLMNEPVFPFATWYPFDWQNNRLTFILLYIHQNFAIFIEVMETMATDTCFLVYVQYFIGHMNALKFRLHDIAKSKRQDKHLELIECIRDHQDILR